MDPLTIIALVNAASMLIAKGVGLLADLQSGKIKPEDIDPESLKMASWEDIVAQAGAMASPLAGTPPKV
jgi:hypothetical protein